MPVQANRPIPSRALIALTTAVGRMQAGDLSVRLPEPAVSTELAELTRAFNRLADTLQQREAERRQMAQRFSAAFESSAIGMALLTLDGNLLAANAAVCRMSGYTEEELRRRNDRENVYPPDADVGMDRFAEMLAGQRGYYSVERRYVRKNGGVFWVRLTLSLVRDDRGQPAYLVGQIEDIDEQKRKSAALAESEARFRTMFETSAIGIGIMGLDRKVLSANPALCQMYGYTCEELVGQTSVLVIHPDDYPRSLQALQDLLAGKCNQFSDERRYVRKNGEVFWARIAMSMVRDAEGAPLYIVGMVADINEERLAKERLAAQEAEYRRQLEQRIAERTEELSAANERLREKATQDAVIAERTRLARDLHDAVTQTLFSTTLIADVLPDIWAMNPAEGKRRLEEVRQLTRGALAEMRTLLVELRPNALTEIPLPILLRQLTEGLVSRARIIIQFNAEGACKLPPDVQVGFYRIAQEALNNVVKHARASQAVVTLRLCEPVRLTVADNGVGFDLSAVTADHLGLRIMRERAEAIGARLSVYSEPGEGTQVSVVWQQP